MTQSLMKRKAQTGEPDTSIVRKKARRVIGADEYAPVTKLERYRLPLYRAEAFYMPDFVDAKLAQDWHDQLDALSTWYQPTLKVYGRSVTQSRHIAAYATDPKLEVKYSGTVVQMHHAYPPVLEEIQRRVESCTGVSFNHVMLNRYEHGKIYIGNHRDNIENRVIASVSVGAPRTFVLTYDPPKNAPPEDVTDSRGKLRAKRWLLANGSLVVMQGEMQKYWKHSIPKEPQVKDSRISLTFRQLCF